MRPVVLAFVVLVTAVGPAGCGDRASDGAAGQAKAAADEAAKAKILAEADAAVEATRLASLWTYSDVPAGAGKQVAATIKSTNDIDTDGQGARSVLLVFRDHSAWGRSSYLVLTAGDFKCAPRCTVSVKVDESPAMPMAAHRPKTDEAIAMFIDDARALWRATAGARRLSVEFPVKVGGTRTATYDVGGLDRSKMPGWDGGPARDARP